jgi:hypothetical protein
MPRAWGAYSPALEYRGQQETITRNQGALRWVYGNSAENVSAKETPSEATKGMTGIGKANGEVGFQRGPFGGRYRGQKSLRQK